MAGNGGVWVGDGGNGGTDAAGEGGNGGNAADDRRTAGPVEPAPTTVMAVTAATAGHCCATAVPAAITVRPAVRTLMAVMAEMAVTRRVDKR